MESSGEGESYEVSKVFTYPLYQGAMTQWDHDIAILKVKPFFKFSANISKICVPLNVPYNRSTVAVTGWGTTTDGGWLGRVGWWVGWVVEMVEMVGWLKGLDG